MKFPITYYQLRDINDYPVSPAFRTYQEAVEFKKNHIEPLSGVIIFERTIQAESASEFKRLEAQIFGGEK